MQRQQMILEHLESSGTSSYEGLAEMFGVSVMTVRRDANRLAERGAVVKTLGGIQKAATESSNLHETALLSRLATQRREKKAIAREAVNLLKQGQTVFVDGGTTSLELVRLAARERKGLTVVTNSIMVCRELGQNGDNLVIGLGGQYDPASLSFAGSACEEEAGKFFPDMAVFSTKGLMPADGTYESFVPTLRVKQIVAKHSKRVVLLADHTKFGQRALCKALDISEIHDVVTDGAAPAEGLAELKELGKRVWIAESAPQVSKAGR